MVSMSAIPLAPGALPVLGHAPLLLRRPLEFLRSLPAHGDLVRVKLGPADVIVVCDAALTQQVLLDDRTFDKGGPIFERVREITGGGLVSCPHSMHRRQRRLLQPAFHHSRLPGYAATMVEHITGVVHGWRHGSVLSVFEEMNEITTSALTATIFSDALRPEQVRSSREDFDALMRIFVKRMVVPPWASRLPLPVNRRWSHLVDRLRTMVAEVVAERRRDGADHGDLLSTLLAADDPESTGSGRKLSDAEIVDQVLTFYLAGGETAAASLSWALHAISTHPEVQDRLHEEVDTVLAGRPPTFADLPRLELTARVLDETLRLWPPGWIVTRRTSAATTLGGHAIPAGADVAYSSFLIQNRGDLFPDPTTFDPDRWTAGRPAANQASYIPFAGGARKCIGDRFAVVEEILTLAAITSHWRLAPVSDDPVEIESAVTLRPRLSLRVLARH